jgi:DNA-directed RNA polymerase subunit beta'
MEARVLMMSTNNILSPANGRPIINPTQDIVLGLYYATRERKFAKGSHREGALQVDKKGHAEGYLRGTFSSVDEVRMAYDNGEVTLHSGIRVRVPANSALGVGQPGENSDGTAKWRTVNTTVGRCLIAEILPEGLGFDLVNKTLDKRALS